jgi:Na+/H+ antiporter NhaC
MITVAFAGLIITGAENSYEELLLSGVKISNYSFPKVWELLGVLGNKNKISFLHKIGMLMGNSDFYIPLLWSSFAGITFAVLSTLSRKGISIRTTMENLVQGFRIMISAVIILIFAWALAEVIEDLHTSDYITSLISSRFIYPQLLPVVIFITAALFSFGVGSIWGSMAILYPLLLPVSWIICTKAGLNHEDSKKIIYEVISVIITGSVFGNHCSPISDTTIVSSISSNCNHITHIKTQVPYALTVAGVSLTLLLFSLFNLHWAVNYTIGIVLIFFIVRYFGKTIE